MNPFPLRLLLSIFAFAAITTAELSAHGGGRWIPPPTLPPAPTPDPEPTPSGPPPNRPAPRGGFTPRGSSGGLPSPPPPGRTGGVGGASAPGGGGGGATSGKASPSPGGGGGGMSVGFDFTRWVVWWDYNKDGYINLRSAVHDVGVMTESDGFYMGAGLQSESKDTLRPSKSMLRDTVVPKLKEVLDTDPARDVVSGCMLALAKIGLTTEEVDILGEFRERLASHDLELRQVAAVCMGISHLPEAAADLIAVATDTKRGRELCRRRRVDYPTRTFAIYGLGQLAFATQNAKLKRRIFEALEPMLDPSKRIERNVRTAAISTLGLLNPADDPNGRALVNFACHTLERYWNKKAGPGEQFVQAHVPTAIAKLLRSCSDEPIRKRVSAGLIETVRGKDKLRRSRDQIKQSSALALGQLADPTEAGASEMLFDYFKKGSDRQTRNFCLMSLGQIGGEANKQRLLEVLRKGNKALERPWAALSLGVYCFDRRGEAVDNEVGEALRATLRDVKNPDTRGAIAIALGLARITDAADELRGLLEKHVHNDEFAGYLCLGLALMGDERSGPQIQKIVEDSVRRPQRLQSAAIALGKLGDKEAAGLLVKMLKSESTSSFRLSSISAALGYIGDRRSLPVLLEMVADDSLGGLPRAFAAIAIGGVADKELLRWNAKIAADMNYHAAVETMIGNAQGVLDIL